MNDNEVVYIGKVKWILLININFSGSSMKAIYGYKPFPRYSNKVNDTGWPVPAGK